MPHSPFRYVLNTLLYVLITGCRWCDVPKGKIWASQHVCAERRYTRLAASQLAVQRRTPVRPMLSAWTNQRFVMVKALGERCFAWFQKKYRRLVVRWERISICFNAFLSLATIHIWINRILLLG